MSSRTRDLSLGELRPSPLMCVRLRRRALVLQAAHEVAVYRTGVADEEGRLALRALTRGVYVEAAHVQPRSPHVRGDLAAGPALDVEAGAFGLWTLDHGAIHDEHVVLNVEQRLAAPRTDQREEGFPSGCHRCLLARSVAYRTVAGLLPHTPRSRI
jgi:hypothetical protein